MKNKLSILGILLTVLLLSSCLGEAEFEMGKMTSEIATKWINSVAGSYTGVVYVDDPTTKLTNSYKANWSINANDSVLTLKDFPLSAFAPYATDEDAMILKSAPNITFQAVMHPFNGGYTHDYSYYLTPLSQELSSVVNYEGTDYPVKVHLQLTLTTTGQYEGETVQNYMIALFFMGGVGPFDANIIVGDVQVGNHTHTVNSIARLYGIQES